MVLQAKGRNVSHIFFLDSDVILPPDGLIRLFSHQLAIVSALYGSKHGFPGVWIKISESGEKKYSPIRPDVLVQHSLFTHPDIVIGMGACLIDIKVFDRIPEPWFYWTQGREKDGVSEDFYFCEKIRQHIPIFVDTTVQCRHLDFAHISAIGERSKM